MATRLKRSKELADQSLTRIPNRSHVAKRSEIATLRHLAQRESPPVKYHGCSRSHSRGNVRLDKHPQWNSKTPRQCSDHRQRKPTPSSEHFGDPALAADI